MTGRAALLPILTLALLAGCAPSSGDGARSGNRTKAAENGAAALTPAANAAGPAMNASPTVAEPLQPAQDSALGEPSHSLDLPASNDAAPDDRFPQEVTAFMVDRDGCDHFRGEEPYDTDRRAYLDESIAELCTGTDARLAVLKQRYAKDKAVTAALGQYEDRIEANVPP